MKILFAHTSKETEPEISAMPIGLVALANFLYKNGFKSEIVNVFVEKKINKNFDLVDYVVKNDFDIVCFSLHWHHQLTAVIDAARKIKERKNCKIILGGFTASFFAKEIMEEFDFIDFVIKGDAEMPLLELVKEKKLDEIPNLVWRKDGKVVENKTSYVADKEILNQLDFTDLSLLKNNKIYKQFGLEKNRADNKWFFMYNAGRGCDVNCSFCSGSEKFQKIINNRNKVVFIDEEIVLEALKNLAKDGVGVWYTSFDPTNDYYISLFKKIKENNLKLRCKFECWKLPTKEFIDEFKKTFMDGSELVISPDSGSEKIREKNKGYFYTNKEFFEVLDYCRENKINAVVYFSAGFPYETLDDFTETLKLVNFLRAYPNVFVNALPIEIEPASPWFLDSKKYKIKKFRNDLMDFYNAHKSKSGVGYETGFFKEDEIPELVSLIMATANCKMKKPVFLKILEEYPFKEKLNAKDLWEMCGVCGFYGECWGK